MNDFHRFAGCPISNHVLKLNSDFRTHPIAEMLANNLPLVISSDDPSFWETYAVTHDFYVTFVYISSYRHDIRVLKKLITNSMKYSALNKEELAAIFPHWFKNWVSWLKEVSETNVTDEKMKLDILSMFLVEKKIVNFFYSSNCFILFSILLFCRSGERRFLQNKDTGEA